MQIATTDPGWDEQNLSLTHLRADVDRVNAEFYGNYPFPPRAHRLERPLDPDFQRRFLCQDLGDWWHQAIPLPASIWVAGCGTNQALITSLAFPRASIVGSDVSRSSLDMAERGLQDLSLGNLQLREESLNAVSYREEFDYIVCTGVIHHNADPAAVLQRIARALKPAGVLELMVYSRYQRIPSSCVQKALLILAGGKGAIYDAQTLQMAEGLVNGFDAPGRMGAFLRGLRGARRAELADALFQPVEYSYTVASLDDLGGHCGLEMLLPVVNAFDKLKGNTTWNLTFPTAQLQEAYLRCDDVERWQLANLLLGECSPLLWFYFRRASGTVRPNEQELCKTFLSTCFARAATRKQAYVLGADDRYRLVPGSIAFPPSLPDPLRAVIDAADGKIPMREILEKQNIATAFPEVNEIRARLTTTAFPYLTAVV